MDVRRQHGSAQGLFVLTEQQLINSVLSQGGRFSRVTFCPLHDGLAYRIGSLRSRPKVQQLQVSLCAYNVHRREKPPRLKHL